ncbi:cytoskeletal protein binding protein [Elasticomyces elasticus]|nr:cytoskeletal protein binding protein [Elasticomyces elasticus]
MPFLDISRALYAYTPQSPEELALLEGDLLFILEKSTTDDWWRCKKKAANEDDDEPEGLVPNNYVERVSPLYSVKALYDYSPQTDEEVGFEEGGKLECYDDGDPDWMLVGVEGGKGGYGFAPSNYLERETAQSAASIPAAPAMSTQRELAPPPSMPIRSRPAAEEAIPGEADYPDPGLGPSPSPDPAQQQHNPAAGLAAIIAQRTGGQQQSPSSDRALASPPLPSRRPQYTPDQSDDDEPPPPMPTRPRSQQTPQPTPRIASQPLQSPRQISSYTPPGFAPAVEDDYENPSQQFTPSRLANSPSGAFHLYNIHETISHIGKNKKLPTVLGINIPRGLITIAPEKAKDGPTQEWTAEKLTHYSIEGKHVFVELVRPSRSVDFHAGAKDTAKEIVGMLGELAGWQRGGGGFDEVLDAASSGTGGGRKRGRMLYEFMAQGDDEVTVDVGDEVLVLDDKGSEEWWKVRRLKNGREGVVPSSYVEVIGRVEGGGDAGVPGLRDARGVVEFNRSEEERLAKLAVGGKRDGGVPARGSSLAEDGERGQRRSQQQRSSGSGGEPRRQGSGTTDSAPAKSKPNMSRLRTWTDRSGTFKVEAEFIGLREGKIHLHKTNGVKIAVPVNKMAVEDLEYVEEKTGKSLDEDKPLSDIKRRNTERQKKRDEEGGRDSSKTPVKRGGTGAGASVVEGNGYDWFDFFLGCGVNPQICERYASAFARDQMGVEVLPDVNEQLLRTLGLKEGDILRVMKFLDKKFGRGTTAGGLAGPSPGGMGVQQDDSIMPVNGSGGGLFSGKDGVLRNNTQRKGRPAPPVLANDVVDESAFRPKVEEPPARREDARATPLASAAARQATGGGFEDDAWDVKPARTQAMAAVQGQGFSAEAPKAVEPPRVVQQQPKLNDDLALLAMPLQPAPTGTVAPPPVQVQAPAPVQGQQQQHAPPPATPQQQQGADQALFDKIAALAPARQRPQPPAITQLQQSGGTGLAPPPRAASAPGFNPQQGVNGGQFGPLALQPQLTGYQPQAQGMGMYGQQTGFNPQQQQTLGMGMQQQGGFQPQMTGVQQSFPALQPQPTGMAFAPQSQFGQLAAGQQYGQQPQQMPQQMGMQQGFQQQGFQQQLPQQTGFQQSMVNGSSTGSPFADPPRMPFQALPSGLQNQFAPQPQQTGFQQPQQTGFQQPQQTGFQQQQQPSFNISQPTGSNGFGGQQQQYAQQPPPPPVPQLPPQQTGGVFGPAAPLVPQKTGPPPPVRFGVQPAANKLMPQATGRANLGRATPQNPFGF